MSPVAGSITQATGLHYSRLVQSRCFSYVSFPAVTTLCTSPMNQEADANHFLLPDERFTGELSLDGCRIPIQLTASAGRSGRLELTVDPILTENPSVAIRILMRSVDKPGDIIHEFALDCTDSGGRRLTSDCAYLTRCNLNSQGLQIELRTRVASLTMPAVNAQQRPALRFWLRGFACFPAVHVVSTIGPLLLHGATRASATDEITGYVAAEADDSCVSNDWHASAMHILTHLKTVLSFARGAPLPVPITEYFSDRHVEVTFHDSSAGTAPMMPPLSHLDLRPIVTTAVANIESIDSIRDTFELAVGWLTVPTAIDEIRVLSGMTALESVASRSLPSSQTSILSRSKSDRLAKRVRSLVDAHEDIDGPDRDAIKDKLPELNRRPFIQQVHALLAHWNISRTSIKSEELSCLIGLRNKLIHRGSAEEGENLWPATLLIQEVVVRLVLSMIQFEGTYQCYLGGRHTRRFPDCEPLA